MKKNLYHLPNWTDVETVILFCLSAIGIYLLGRVNIVKDIEESTPLPWGKKKNLSPLYSSMRNDINTSLTHIIFKLLIFLILFVNSSITHWCKLLILLIVNCQLSICNPWFMGLLLYTFSLYPWIIY
jgi:hypothetical protein